MEDLIRLIDYLKSIDAPVIKLLQRGIAINEVRETLKKVSLNATGDIENLYHTINGTAASNDYLGMQYFFPGHIMLSIEKAIELYSEECLSYNSWESGYLPIFWNGNRDYLLIDCLNKAPGIYFYSPDEFRFDRISKKYDSLNSLLVTVLKCFEAKAYQLGDTLKDIKFSGDKVFAISKEMNPQSEYWDF